MRFFKVLIVAVAMMSLVSCTPSQVACAMGSTAGCVTSMYGF